jgi:hypothetical protein
MIIGTIRSGGQTGVDRAALNHAIERGMAYAGWCPRDGWAEDYPDPPGLLAKYPRLVETPSADPSQRTAWNVRDSHATLILAEDGALPEGTLFTLRCAKLIFLRPCLAVDPGMAGSVRAAADWLVSTAAALDHDELVLNVGGPRQSEAAGIYNAACRFLQKLHSELFSRGLLPEDDTC